jgi:hypothetical protein
LLVPRAGKVVVANSSVAPKKMALSPAGGAKTLITVTAGNHLNVVPPVV